VVVEICYAVGRELLRGEGGARGEKNNIRNERAQERRRLRRGSFPTWEEDDVGAHWSAGFLQIGLVTVGRTYAHKHTRGRQRCQSDARANALPLPWEIMSYDKVISIAVAMRL